MCDVRCVMCDVVGRKRLIFLSVKPLPHVSEVGMSAYACNACVGLYVGSGRGRWVGRWVQLYVGVCTPVPCAPLHLRVRVCLYMPVCICVDTYRPVHACVHLCRYL